MVTQRKRILVVEDNARLRTVIQQVLAGRYEVVVAGDLKTMEQELQQHAFHLVITDLNLPDGDSTSVLHRLDHFRMGAQEVSGLAVPTLVITGLDEHDEEFEKARRMPSVLAVLRKPLDTDALRRQVDEFLGEGPPEPAGAGSASSVFDPTLHVLVVDEDSETHTRISLALEGAGYQMRSCSSAEDALAACRGHRYQLALISYLLDGDPADELLAALQESLDAEAQPAVIILSDLGEALTLANFRRFPLVKDIVPRQASLKELREKVEDFIGNRRRQRTQPLARAGPPSSGALRSPPLDKGG